MSSKISISGVNDTLHLKPMDKECTELAMFCVCCWWKTRKWLVWNHQSQWFAMLIGLLCRASKSHFSVVFQVLPFVVVQHKSDSSPQQDPCSPPQYKNHISDYFCGAFGPFCFTIKLQVFNQQLIQNFHRTYL